MTEETPPIMFTSLSFIADPPLLGPCLLPDLRAEPVELTIEAWINVRTQRQYAGIWSGATEFDCPREGFGLQLDGASGIQFYLQPPGQPAQHLSSGADTITLNTWHHVAVTYDGQRMSTYVDGELATTRDVQAASLQASTFPRAMFLGAHGVTVSFDPNVTPVACFDGQLSELRMWTRCISAELIAKGRDQRLRGDETGLLIHWPLNGSLPDETNYRKWVRVPQANSFPPLTGGPDWGVPGIWKAGDAFMVLAKARNVIFASRLEGGSNGDIGYGEVSGDQLTMTFVSGKIQTGTIAAGSRQIVWDDQSVWERHRVRA